MKLSKGAEDVLNFLIKSHPIESRADVMIGFEAGYNVANMEEEMRATAFRKKFNKLYNAENFLSIEACILAGITIPKNGEFE